MNHITFSLIESIKVTVVLMVVTERSCGDARIAILLWIRGVLHCHTLLGISVINIL